MWERSLVRSAEDSSLTWLGLKSVYLIAAIIFVISTVMVLFIEKNPAPHLADQDSVNGVGLLKMPVL